LKVPLPYGAGTADLNYLVKDVDRYGRLRVYFRRGSNKKIKLKAELGTQEFMNEYAAALAGSQIDQPVKEKTAARSLKWLCERYYESGDYKRLADSTKSVRRKVLDEICLSQVTKPSGGKVRRGDLSFANMQRRHVIAIRDEKAEVPHAAKNRTKFLCTLFNWAIEVGHMETNPATKIKPLTKHSDGHHTWTVEECYQFQGRWQIGTRERLAYALMLYLGVRRSDVVKLGRQMITDGWITFTETKNEKNAPKERELPILPVLQNVIDQTPVTNFGFVVTQNDRPFSPNGFGNWFKDACRAANLPHCSAHGLRKAGATLAAENGASEDDLKAIFGWANSGEVKTYTRKARSRKILSRSMGKISLDSESVQQSDDTETQSVQPSGKVLK